MSDATQNQVHDQEESAFQLVLHGGNARGEAYEALDLAAEGKFGEAQAALDRADQELEEGHLAQTRLLQGGTELNPTLLMVHAQDHLMTALAELTLVKRLVTHYKKVQSLEERLERLEQSGGGPGPS